ncbi:rod shape-determining protein [Calditrichota bacterium]
MSLFRMFLSDLGIDLGTANTVIFLNNKGFIVNEPSVVALDQDYHTIALGKYAKQMMGKIEPSIKVVRPLAHGVIADFEAGEAMVRGFIRSAKMQRFLIGRVVIGVPTGITQVEKRAIMESTENAGAREVYLIAEPMAAAIGIGIDINAGNANMIVDIGGGTTDIAVINYGGIVVDNTIRMAGDDLNEAIVRHMKAKYHLKIGELTAEQIKIEHGCIASKVNGEIFMVKGMDVSTGLPCQMEIPYTFFDDALSDVIGTIISAILRILEILPEELVSDIIDRGIVLTGGGSLLRGLDDLIRQKTNLPVSIADNPLHTVAIGTREILYNFEKYERAFMKM